MLIRPASLVSMDKIQKKCSFRTRLVGLICTLTKEYFIGRPLWNRSMYWRDRNITSFAPFLEAIELLLKMVQKFWKTCIRPFYGCLLRADLHGTICVESLRQAYDATYDCRSVLKHVLKCYDIFLTYTPIVNHVVDKNRTV